MIQGRINNQREPRLSLEVHGIDGPVDVILDTGFSGALCLSKRHIECLGMTPKGVEWYELGNGSLVAQPVYLVRIRWFGSEREVEAIMTGAEDSMIGSELMIGCLVTLDYASGELAIERR